MRCDGCGFNEGKLAAELEAQRQAELNTGASAYECNGFWGVIHTKYGDIEVSRQGTDTEKDTVAFSGTLNDPESQVTYELKATKV